MAVYTGAQMPNSAPSVGLLGLIFDPDTGETFAEGKLFLLNGELELRHKLARDEMEDLKVLVKKIEARILAETTELFKERRNGSS